ncbi:tetratricopeptide repeat protein [Leptospira borgpetersenii]|uniref:Tetratricopeptide repeat protein n=1 Tax=Leptospira borgpetersenii serovar Javanica str. UI 09931 TaxID=1049767 RepID=A0AAV3JB65_LEPBO|nr:tetratricopeptide repeat protein [Leptospira borgpetersenii]AXX14478.1 tetratricopeptide repeat protein [Leptospira borgpetersenii serovar Ceylonica]EKQ91822.1 tetratricopeptide repeat protein [Leptospira borgpetersenii str. UI 09149]EMN59339.1 tetratricopeptide repeat protein [Leptospira borgpetersenii serovar Javanica str. MK146]EPG57967.1 tetratricopeptide repeat protein [Leptospira borgpetersenii serovar Javanica str. UI 09931]MDQ7243586.1 tetratricopeptide repeat protein [Leptospira bo
MLGKRNRLLILLFLFGSVLFATPDDNFDREISLNEVLTQYKLKNFSVVLRLANRTTPLNRSENLALNYLRAHSFLQLKEYKNALEQFLNLLGEVPYKYEIFNNIGACYFYLGDYENALRYFDFSKTENPNYKIAEKNYILLRNATATKTLESNWISPTDFPETFLVFSSANADISTGWIYFYLGKPTEAIHLFKKAIKSDPEYSLSYLSLGYLYDSGGNFRSAIRYYEAALKIDPEYPDLWNNLAISYYNDGKTEKALSHFQKAAELNPTFAYPVNNLGYLHLQKGDYTLAKKYFLRSIELNPSGPFLLGETYAGLSICNFHFSERDEAKRNKKRSIELHQNLANAAYLIKELRWKQNIVDVFLNRIDTK